MLAIRHSFATLLLTGVLAVGFGQNGFAQDASAEKPMEEKPMEAMADPASVVLTIGDTEVTELDLTIAGQDFAEVLADIPENQKREKLVELMIDLHTFAQEAKAKNLDESETFARRIKLMEARALRNAFFEQEIMENVTDADVKSRFDVEMAKITPEVTVSARHILVAEEDEAKKIIEELQGGADFEALAKERSTGPSGPNGGDLGQFSKGQMVPPFEAAAFALDAGTFTVEPVQTQFGWHIIQVYEKGSAPLPEFAQVEEQVRNLVISERFTEQLDILRGKYEVKRAAE
ncbi:MAG: peptidylprolyl isomerase [Alphaproteobacteria bacterium]